MSGGAWQTAPAAAAIADNGYLSLRGLAAYASVSRATLRKALTDPVNPLPHYQLPGKVLVRRSDFDAWLLRYKRSGADIRRGAPALEDIVEDVVAGLRA